MVLGGILVLELKLLVIWCHDKTHREHMTGNIDIFCESYGIRYDELAMFILASISLCE